MARSLCRFGGAGSEAPTARQPAIELETRSSCSPKRLDISAAGGQRLDLGSGGDAAAVAAVGADLARLRILPEPAMHPGGRMASSGRLRRGARRPELGRRSLTASRWWRARRLIGCYFNRALRCPRWHHWAMIPARSACPGQNGRGRRSGDVVQPAETDAARRRRARRLNRHRLRVSGGQWLICATPLARRGNRGRSAAVEPLLRGAPALDWNLAASRPHATSTLSEPVA